MPQISRSCPHCDTEKVGFVPLGVWDNNRTMRAESLLFLQCENCGQGLVLVMPAAASTIAQWTNGYSGILPPVRDEYPVSQEVSAPADIPKAAETAFLSGVDNLSRPNGSNAAALMFRRCIEVAVKSVNPTGKGDLKKRISDLPDSVATPAMKDWAHHIRLDGNDAAHEVEEYSVEDAQSLNSFAEMFLTYAFTLPAMLNRAREDTESVE